MTTYGKRSVPDVHQEPGLWIAGLGTQYPRHLLRPESLEAFAERFYDSDNAGMKRLLEINRTTGIETRSAVLDYSTDHAADGIPTSLAGMDFLFRTAGVDMTVQACKKAIQEWEVRPDDITHTVAVTCTNQGNPGYDVLVNERLGLSTSVERILLQGFGCAGGLAIMRTAAQLAYGATMRGRAARILCFACELSTPNIKHELDAVANCTETSQTSIAAALFSDAAAAFVVCNDLGLQNGIQPVLELLDWDHALIPGTSSDLEFTAEDKGYRTVLKRSVSKHAVSAINPMFDRLLSRLRTQTRHDKLDVGNFDWALHPGGRAIIDGVQRAMKLTEEQLRATREIYRHRGNSSSPSVLAVLDKLRSITSLRNYVVAAAFGPGMSVEMSCFRYVRVEQRC